MTKRTVGYFTFNDQIDWSWYDLLGYEPEKVVLGNKIIGKARFCPALKNVVKNTYVIRSPFTLDLSHQIVNNKTYIVVNPQSSLNPNKFNDLFSVNELEDRTDINVPMFQMRLPYVFISDDDVELQLSAPHLDYKPLPGVTGTGSYNIYKWHRPINWLFNWHETDKPIKIKRGDPLLYIKLLPKDRDDEIVLKKIEQTDELKKSVKKCQQSVAVTHLMSSELINMNGISRAKHMMKSHIGYILDRFK